MATFKSVSVPGIVGDVAFTDKPMSGIVGDVIYVERIPSDPWIVVGRTTIDGSLQDIADALTERSTGVTADEFIDDRMRRDLPFKFGGRMLMAPTSPFPTTAQLYESYRADIAAGVRLPADLLGEQPSGFKVPGVAEYVNYIAERRARAGMSP